VKSPVHISLNDLLLWNIHYVLIKLSGLSVIEVVLTCMTPPPLLPGEDAMNSSGSPIALPESIDLCL
jgi:hypothetical protein